VLVVLVCVGVINLGGVTGVPAKLDNLDSQRGGYNYNPPAPQGYNYNPPAQPVNLYEVPKQPSGLYDTPLPPPTARPPTTRPTPPPPPPSGLYDLPNPSNPVPATVRPPPPPQTRPPPPPPPSPPSATRLPPPPPSQTTTASPMMGGMPYDFDWGVNDPESGNQFSQKEESDGNVVRGEYRVLLPDGRLQIVRYFDDGNGFNVDITYE
ncbi:hypothetical protein SK128_017481, partial [Halocaridina rubra]